MGTAGSGGASRDRTGDLYNAIVALSQLSYGPTLEPERILARAKSVKRFRRQTQRFCDGGLGNRLLVAHAAKPRSATPRLSRLKDTGSRLSQKTRRRCAPDDGDKESRSYGAAWRRRHVTCRKPRGNLRRAA